ncbi:HAD family hydrolase [Oceanobacillus picturae]|uniref:Acid sugar phosphatase n=1 Tax=Oceanobacillus picturae TaxID=171693 RepID=A0A0U9HB61_9BACI|nr:HAD family hydrolase [Oceanobacillus picturae]
MKGFIFDLDGTVYVEDRLIEGAAEVLTYLRKRGDKVVFLTNKPIATRMDYLLKLKKLGIQSEINEIINSNYLTANYLKQNTTRDDAIFVIGEQPLMDELKKEKINLTDDSSKATIVVLSWDRKFSYEKIYAAYQAWAKNNAKIVATNPDRTCPVSDGEVPDCGAIIGAIEGATGRKIDYVIGKPSRFTAKHVVEQVLKLKPENCYMVGDRLDTDIRMGKENGLNTILVLSGVTNGSMVKHSTFKPTYVMESVKGIMDVERYALFPEMNI